MFTTTGDCVCRQTRLGISEVALPQQSWKRLNLSMYHIHLSISVCVSVVVGGGVVVVVVVNSSSTISL